MRRNPLQHTQAIRRAVKAKAAEVRTPPPLLPKKHTLAEDLHDWILGGQDGLVNVLGSVLGVAIVTTNKYIIIVAGLAAIAAESISLGAVAYTSVKANRMYYDSERARLRAAIDENPVLQRELLIDAYERKGMTRTEATRIILELTKDKELWTEALMQDHLRLYPPDEEAPVRSATIVGLSSLLGAIIPLIPFFFIGGTQAILISCISSLLMLFLAGAFAAKLTVGDWKKRGFEMAAIGMTAAMVSFAIGFAFSHAVTGG